MDGKIVQLELELEEMQSRVSKLEEFYTNLAKWTKFPDHEFSEILNNESCNENSHHRVPNTDDDFAPEVSNPQQLPEDDDLDEEDEFVFKIDVDDDEDKGKFKIEFDFEDNKVAGSSQDPFELSDSSTEEHGEPVKKRPKTKLPTIHKIHPEFERLPCPICPSTLKHKKGLVEHIRKTHKSKSQTLISKALETSTEKKNINQKKDLYQCYFCPRIFTDPANFQKHFCLHTEEHPYRCSKCQFTCYLKRDFKNHNHFNTSTKPQKIGENKCPHKCPYCPHATRKRSNLHRHIRLIHMNAEPRQCYFCPKIFRSNQDLQRHFVIHTTERPYKCARCQFTTGFYSSLMLHNQSKHNVNSIREDFMTKNEESGKFCYKCPHCSYTTTANSQSSRNLEAHIASCHTTEADKKFECEICKQKFGLRSLLTKHMTTHQKHPCPHCPFETRRKVNLKTHIRLIHEKMDFFKCYFCPKRFRSYQDLQRHFIIHTTERRYKCNRCHFTTRFLKTLKLHNQSKHNVNSLRENYKIRSETDGKLRYKCPHCSYITAAGSNSSHLDTHIAYNHTTEESKQFECKICKKKFGLRNLLRDHMKSHRKLPEKTLLCHHCPFVTRNPTNLNIHIRTIHEEIKDDDYFKCYFCQRKITHSSNLNAHMRTHTGECPYSCDLCPHRTSDASHLRNHTKKVHLADLTGRDFKCAKCQSTFKTQWCLEAHEKLHTKNAFKCSLCPDLQPFLSSSLLRQHFLKEHPKGGLNHSCPHCPKKFKHHDTLQSHINAHTGARSFKCEKCIYATNRHGNLAKHVKICKGSSEKGVDCDQCGQTFTNEGNVKRHKSKWHPKDEILNCQYGNHIFRDKDNLQTHLEKRHGDKI